ncbi:MAG: PhoX family phosphatase [Proteobacteria bacterium]|nr:PhoX family phosphatase [Pseudomonadota bacterium]
MSKSYSDPLAVANPSVTGSLARLLEARLSRRQVLQGATLLPLLGLPLGCATPGMRADTGEIGFSSISGSREDRVRVPAGYSANVVYRWGDPVGSAAGMPAFKTDGSNTAAEQALQAGMHHDGIEYFAMPYGSQSSARGLLVMNHEYTDDGLLHTDGFDNWSAEKVRKAQNGHGVSVIEVENRAGQWSVVRPSRYARRITAQTPMRIAGPAAGHASLKTVADPAGTEVLGTINNCASGYTPWGTYLTCEENWNGYFINAGTIPPEQRRYGVTEKGAGYRWHEFDQRFDAAANPNEPNRFGWVVEIDPFEPASQPVKRTALGRVKHEGAALALTADNRVVFYMGDDQQFEYIYKFVSRDPYNKTDRAANRDLLDHGTLYVAKFNADGSGEWLALVHGSNGLTAENGFVSQADILIKTRQAGDRAGATKMDRPEWTAVNPRDKSVYCTLTNNSARGAKDQPATDAANPRANNTFGHIIRWHERDSDAAALAFKWDIFVLAGDPLLADANKQGNIKGDVFGSPDGLWFDPAGRLWIQTDVSTSVLNRGDYAGVGNNQMLCADPATGRIRRFLTGPKGCEITGITMTPDGASMFINIQHPGETASERSDPAQPLAVSSWPDGEAAGRPRSSTIVIRRDDGGIVGT